MCSFAAKCDSTFAGRCQIVTLRVWGSNETIGLAAADGSFRSLIQIAGLFMDTWRNHGNCNKPTHLKAEEKCVCVCRCEDPCIFSTNRVRTFLESEDIMAGAHNFIMKFYCDGLSLEARYGLRLG